jgi:excisionase family DNA binding protein
MRTSGLLSVGEAAVLLRSSRRHVLDLCARGLLPYVIVGPNRRLRRADVEALVDQSLSRTEREQLWLHRAIAAKFAANPPALLAIAAINLRRLRRLHPEGHSWDWLDRWQAVLDLGWHHVVDVLTSPAAYAVELRGTSPFTGVLSEKERQAALEEMAEKRREQARPVTPETVDRVMRAV